MQRVFVLSQNKQPLMPCHPARARRLLTRQQAKVYCVNPFTIILIDKTQGVTQHAELNLDPGSKTTGVAYVVDCQKGRKVFFAAHLSHRGEEIKQSLVQRRAIRRARRSRKTRYRPPHFNNRTRRPDWLPPSLTSRVDNVIHFVKKIKHRAPISAMAVETVRFDTQKLTNPEISGVLYQQGTLHGFEIREYLLEKWQRRCAYCDAHQVPLEVEHIVPKALGGANRISNLILACRPCNHHKGAQPITDFLKKDIPRLKRISAQTQLPLKDAAAVNATRYRIGNELKNLGIPVSFWTGGRTKFNRTQQKYPKEHWIDAACVGEKGQQIAFPASLRPSSIQACGRGSRQMCRIDRYGFPRTGSKGQKVIFGFKTGDLVKAIVTQGKKKGTYSGRVAVRTSGNFNIKTSIGTIQGINHRYCRLIQHADGYLYLGGSVSPSR